MPTPTTRWRAAAALSIATVFFLFECVVRIEPSTATDAIAADLGLSRTGLGVFSSLFFWVYAPMQIVVGLLIDRWGARRFLVPAILFCALGALGVGVAPSVMLAGAGRSRTRWGTANGSSLPVRWPAV